MDQYQQFIHLSRYARWLEEKNRRETWEETVNRYVNYMCTVQCAGKIDKKTKKEIKEAILNLEVMPSMRALMTAGPALTKDHVASYNCSYLAIDHQRAFSEVLYILMCGTGVGFSVERQYINKLPEVPDELYETDTVIVVPDSKIGWAKALKEVIALLYGGQIPKWDLSKLRPSGARLKTFGGRSSGPEPLDELLHFIVGIFKGAAGRKLTSLECHDIVCKIGSAVVVGGVRRSAEISLSNLSDDRMRGAKSGQWWELNSYRSLANNSACYTEKPDIGIYMREWLALYESKSGERGIFNRVAAKKQASKNGRRDPDWDFGTNPCVPAHTWVMTDSGPKQVSQLINNHDFKILVDGKPYDLVSDGFFHTGHKPVYKVVTKEGHEFEATDNHLIKAVLKQTAKKQYINWVELGDLNPGDMIKLSNHREFEWEGPGTFEEGWLLGELVGDGGFVYPKGGNRSALGYNRFWGDSKSEMADLSLACVKKANLDHRSDLSVVGNGTYLQVACKALYGLAKEYGVDDDKTISSLLESTSSKFYSGFLRGFFDADGSVQGDHKKGISVRLGQANLDRLKVVQRMLLRLGINSTIYQNRRPEGYYPLPDGNGGLKDFYCQTLHDLVVSNDNIGVFAERVGFNEPDKAKKLRELLGAYSRTPNRERFTATIESIELVGSEDVYDVTVHDVHEFDANGVQVHNCSEILLRSAQFCNLSEVVVRPKDTVEDLKRKVRLASIIGTMQSSITDFRFLNKKWKDNCEEERLLGVSLTGIMDHEILSLKIGSEDDLVRILKELKECAINTNEIWAKKLGINQSTAITCVKPSGTVSQLVNSASGIHARFSPYYIRTVRASKTDPLAIMMKDAGVPCEDDVTAPSRTWVFSFPVEAPRDSVMVEERTALEQLDFWLLYQNHWCEHKPSVTIYVKEDEWVEVGAWVYKNFDVVSGISFLPYSDHTYRQAPYQKITKEEYEEALEKMPDIDWAKLAEYEKEDNTVGMQEYACSADHCEVVDLT